MISATPFLLTVLVGCAALLSGTTHAVNVTLPPQFVTNANHTKTTIVSTGENKALADGISFKWTLFAGLDNVAKTADDVIEVTLTSYETDRYAALGNADTEMNGPIIACIVKAADGFPHCSEWTGKGLALGTARRRTLEIRSSKKLSGGGFTITVRMLASVFGVKSNEQQRGIVATGTYSFQGNQPHQHTPNVGRQGMRVNYYTGEYKPNSLQWLMSIFVMVVLCVVWLIVGLIVKLSKTRFSETMKIAFHVLTLAMLCFIFAFSGVLGNLDNERNGSNKRPARAFGRVLVLLFALIFFPVTKHLSVAKVVGSSWERAIPYHAIIGLLIVFCSTAHFIANLFYFENFGDFLKFNTKDYTNNPLPGFLAWVFTIAMAIPSMFFRRKHFKVFKIMHYVCFPLVMICVVLHTPHGAPILAPGLANLVLDYIVRLVCQGITKSNIAVAETSGSNVHLAVKIEGGNENTFVRALSSTASQFALISIPGKLQLWHPFSVASYDAETEQAHFYIKEAGPWTKQLGDMVRGDEITTGTPVRWQGPYGNLEIPLASNPNVLLVAGGIGFTPMLSALDAIANLNVSSIIAGQAKPPVRHVTVVWVLRDPLLAELMAPEVARVTKKLRAAPGVENLTFNLHLTSGETLPATGDDMFTDVFTKRPDLVATLEAAAPAGADATLYCCGPAPLMESCAATAKARPNTWLHTETFEF